MSSRIEQLIDEIEDFKEETIRRGEDQELNLTILIMKKTQTIKKINLMTSSRT